MSVAGEINLKRSTLMFKGQRCFTWLALAGLAVLALPLAVQAATINIILSDMDVIYSGNQGAPQGAIYDNVALPGGTKNPLLADPISQAEFELGGGPPPAAPGGDNTISFDDDRMWADLRVDGIGPALATNVLQTVGANGNDFGLSFFSDSGLMLDLNINELDVLVSPAVFFFTGEVTELVSQNLPFNLQFDPTQPIQISFTATFPTVLNQSTITSAVASGALTISGTQIPEPSTMLLLLAGVTGIGLVAVQRPRLPLQS